MAIARDIKFRAWDKDGIFNNGTACMHYDITGLNIFDSLWHDDDFPKMQYTGLKDKNGKEIYEGDVIQTFKWDVHQRFNEGTENEYVTQKKVEHNIVVKWDDYNARFIVSDTVVTPLSVFREVIGNIYENPDLLK